MRKHTILRKVLIFTCCIIFCYSGWQLFSYYYETRTSKKEFQTLETVAFEEVKDETETIKETGKKEQQEAIDSEGMNIIVSAGAGSGKTAVLSERSLK